MEEAKWHAEIFGVNADGEPCFFIELQRHSVQDQLDINPHLIKLAQELNLPLVCDNDAHFLRSEDWDAHDTLYCISNELKKKLGHAGRFIPQRVVCEEPGGDAKSVRGSS